MLPISRRQFLAAAPPFAVLALSSPLARASQVTPRYGPAQPFSFDGLRQHAKELAGKPYVAPVPAADGVGKIDFDAVQKIKFRPDRGLWRNGPGAFPVRLFHLNEYNTLPVRINEVAGGMAREVLYTRDDFDYGDARLASALPADLGYSGFRIMDGRGQDTDWLAFQGASYFRSSGEDSQYGASARGIAVNTAMTSPEEFPRFVEFWLAGPGERQRKYHHLRVARRSEHHRGLSVRGVKGAGCADRRDRGAVRAHRHTTPRDRTSHQHVLVRGKRQTNRDRLAPARSTTATVWRCGPAAASTSGGRFSIRRRCAPTRTSTRAPKGSA